MRYYKIIDGKAVFYNGESIVIGDRRYLSPSDEILEQDGWAPYVPPAPDASELLSQAKNAKIAQIEGQDTMMDKFTIGEEQMWLGHELRQQLKTSVEAYVSMGVEQISKWFNGQEFTFTASQWLQMLAALEIYAAEVLNTTERHKAEVLALQNIEDVEAYDITEGYPSPLIFSL